MRQTLIEFERLGEKHEAAIGIHRACDGIDGLALGGGFAIPLEANGHAGIHAASAAFFTVTHSCFFEFPEFDRHFSS